MAKDSKEVTTSNHISTLNRVQFAAEQLESCLITHHTLIYFLLQSSSLPWGAQICRGICDSNTELYDQFIKMQSALNSAIFELKNGL